MTLPLVGISVLWLFLFGYLIVASIDFGAGFFNSYSDWTGEQYKIQKVIHRYLSPVWEVTNVFLVFFFVGVVGFFPQTAYYYGSALLVPASISLILLAIRGSYYAFSTYGNKENKVYRLIYGLTGLLIPASLSTVLIISEGGYLDITKTQVQLVYSRLFVSGYAWMVVLMAIVSVLFISASFLTYYANKANDAEAEKVLRGYALFWSIPSIIIAALAMYTLKFHNPEHFKLMQQEVWFFIASILFFIASIYLIYRKHHYGIAFIFVMFQYFFAFLGYGTSHYPYLLYPVLTIYDGFTNTAMATALIVVFIAGLCLLVPSLILLMRLFLFSDRYVKGL